MNTLKLFLLAGTLSVAVSAVDSTYAAASTMTSTSTTTSTTTQKEINQNATVTDIRQSIRSENTQFVEQRRTLRQELKTAPKSERAAIRAELRQLNQQHRAEIAQLARSLRTEVRNLRHNNTTPTTTTTTAG